MQYAELQLYSTLARALFLDGWRFSVTWGQPTAAHAKDINVCSDITFVRPYRDGRSGGSTRLLGKPRERAGPPASRNKKVCHGPIWRDANVDFGSSEQRNRAAFRWRVRMRTWAWAVAVDRTRDLGTRFHTLCRCWATIVLNITLDAARHSPAPLQECPCVAGSSGIAQGLASSPVGA